MHWAFQTRSPKAGQRGVALVITLIMLAVVTFMAVLFLGVARRERSSVKINEDVGVSRLMADAALARAQAQIVANMFADTNRLAYDFMVSTNYQNVNGFKPGRFSADNVNYSMPNGVPAGGANLLLNLANLQYDARAPVFVQTNEFSQNTEFRYYLDFNRNGAFESNGILASVSISSGGSKILGPLEHFVGDPEWIGVLEHPELPHSESNRFVGRFAYLALPAGKSLDLNFIHNHASPLASDTLGVGGVNGFSRNQGVGSWEINLAGFFRGLNTNVYGWPARQYRGYNPLVPGARPIGAAFDDARAVLNYRYGGSRTSLRTLSQLFPPLILQQLRLDGVDEYSDGPFDGIMTPPRVDNDDVLPTRAYWPGAENTNAFVDVQEVFTKTNGTLFTLYSTLTNTMAPVRQGTYDRYTFYRMLGQMGVDSAPALRRKINVNYQNDLESGVITTNAWSATNFFLAAGDALLKAHVWTNMVVSRGGRVYTNYYIGQTPVRPNISITNLQVAYFPTGDPDWNNANRNYLTVTNSEYSADIHRLLQVAANIYDSTTNVGNAYPYLPSVFRPVFTKYSSNLVISGWINATNNANTLLSQLSWWTRDIFGAQRPNRPSDRGTNYFPTHVLLGQPWVIGAKKGYPNFNEFLAQTVIQITRKLDFRKAAPTGPVIQTNQLFLIGISNFFGVEAWNSYSKAYSNRYELRVTNSWSTTLAKRLPNGSNYIVWPQVLPFEHSLGVTLAGGPIWPGYKTNAATIGKDTSGSFLVPLSIGTNFTEVLLPSGREFSEMAYTELPIPRLVPPVVDPGPTPYYPYDRTDRETPQLFLYTTNRLQYIMVDTVHQAIVDYVSLDNLTNEVSLGEMLNPNLTASSALFGDQGFREGLLWETNRAPSQPWLTAGELLQLQVSLGDVRVGAGTWGMFAQGPRNQAEIDVFRMFMGTNSTTPGLQPPRATDHLSPFNPSRKLFITRSWAANDPLVHYTPEDLRDLRTTNAMWILRPPNAAFPDNNLAALNPRYSPWGGNPKKQGQDNTNNIAKTNDFLLSIKDPGVRGSDDWDFPANLGTTDARFTNMIHFPSIGWLGRVHRGTPWQTIYLKSAVENQTNWLYWSGSSGTHPTNDWKIPDLFTAALNENAARGLLGVNQTNVAAWTAVLSGLQAITNVAPDGYVPAPSAPKLFQDFLIEPESPQLRFIVDGINHFRTNQPLGVFTNLGSILGTPELTVRSPYINWTTNQVAYWLNDEAIERIPRQILSLIKEDEPRVVIYAFGQALKPAPRSIATDAAFYGLCTNYQVSGEFASKTMLRFEGYFNDPSQPLKAVVESYNILPPE